MKYLLPFLFLLAGCPIAIDVATKPTAVYTTIGPDANSRATFDMVGETFLRIEQGGHGYLLEGYGRTVYLDPDGYVPSFCTPALNCFKKKAPSTSTSVDVVTTSPFIVYLPPAQRHRYGEVKASLKAKGYSVVFYEGSNHCIAMVGEGEDCVGWFYDSGVMRAWMGRADWWFYDGGDYDGQTVLSTLFTNGFSRHGLTWSDPAP